MRARVCGHEERGLQKVRHPRERNQIVIASRTLAVRLIFAASPLVNDNCYARLLAELRLRSVCLTKKTLISQATIK